jgi:hypothetical protein
MRLIPLLLAATIALHLLAPSPAHAQNSESSLPELAQGLPQSWDQGALIFKERVRGRFPIGTPEQDVVHALENQGFTVSPDGKSASFEQPNIVCRVFWRIFWTADEAQNIRDINGVHGGICL